MENDKKGFMFLRWNGKYSGDAKFIVEDLSSGKQSLFTPGRTQDLCWSGVDLASQPEMSKWQDFGNEVVQDLESVAF